MGGYILSVDSTSGTIQVNTSIDTSGNQTARNGVSTPFVNVGKLNTSIPSAQGYQLTTIENPPSSGSSDFVIKPMNSDVSESSITSLKLGQENVALGYNAGQNAIDISRCTFIGANTQVKISGNNYIQSTAIGYGATIKENNQIVIGTSSEMVSMPVEFTEFGTDLTEYIQTTYASVSYGTNPLTNETNTPYVYYLYDTTDVSGTFVYNGPDPLTIHYAVVGAGGGGGGGTPGAYVTDSDYYTGAGGGGGGGTLFNGSLDIQSSTFNISVGSGGSGGIKGKPGSIGVDGNISRIEGFYNNSSRLEISAQGGKAGLGGTTQGAMGGNSGSGYLGGYPLTNHSGGGAGMASNGGSADSTYGGSAGDGYTITFHDTSTYTLCSGGAGNVGGYSYNTSGNLDGTNFGQGGTGGVGGGLDYGTFVGANYNYGTNGGNGCKGCVLIYFIKRSKVTQTAFISENVVCTNLINETIEGVDINANTITAYTSITVPQIIYTAPRKLINTKIFHIWSPTFHQDYINYVNISIGTSYFSPAYYVYYKSECFPSTIEITCESYYTIVGSGGDTMESMICRTANEQPYYDGMTNYYVLAQRKQYYQNSSGGGTRSGTLLPITGVFLNSSTSEMYFNLCVKTSQSSDAINFANENNTYNHYVRINEYTR